MAHLMRTRNSHLKRKKIRFINVIIPTVEAFSMKHKCCKSIEWLFSLIGSAFSPQPFLFHSILCDAIHNVCMSETHRKRNQRSEFLSGHMSPCIKQLVRPQFPDQGSNPPLSSESAESQPLDHQGISCTLLLSIIVYKGKLLNQANSKLLLAYKSPLTNF